MKYIILADSRNSQPFNIPRQLTEVNGEKLIARTIRLLKENGIEDIIITSHDERFDGLGATRYEPLHNDWNPIDQTGYWLSAFPIELLDKPICFLFGDVYYSEEAIEKIVNTETDGILFFCTHNNENPLYIKKHDEPLAFKVEDYSTFKKHIDFVKKKKDKGECVREPITWELYRSINGQDINVHKMTKNYVAINDISCDIDFIEDIDKLRDKARKKLSIVIPYYKTYELTKKLLYELVVQLTDDVEVFLVDDGCNETRLDKFAGLIDIKHQDKNYGATICMNDAIKRSTGKYIAIIDSDDMITTDYIETLLKAIDEHTEDTIYFAWQDMWDGNVVRHPTNYAPWKAIYKREVMPLFREGWRYSYDVPFQEDLAKRKPSRYDIDKVLYIYNSNREGSLTLEKAEIIAKEKKG